MIRLETIRQSSADLYAHFGWVERNVAGKIRKDVVRKRAREEWDRRQRQGKSKERAVLAKL